MYVHRAAFLAWKAYPTLGQAPSRWLRNRAPALCTTWRCGLGVRAVMHNVNVKVGLMKGQLGLG